MASGIIYLSIVGMWVAYFVPRWVHSHEESSGKSTERYKSALRNVTTASGEAPSQGVVASAMDAETKVAQTLLQRRIVFSILNFGMIISLASAIIGNLPYKYSSIPLTGLALYVAHVRRQSVAERLQRRRVSQLHRTTVGVSTTNLSKVFTPKESRDHWVPLADRELSGVVILPKGSAQVRNSWQPQNVPVPTYVNAPKAVSSSRIIDLTIPGAWSDEQERLSREAFSAAAPSRDEVFDQQLAEEAVERLRVNRAVNE